jgi:hypothetical protein
MGVIVVAIVCLLIGFIAGLALRAAEVRSVTSELEFERKFNRNSDKDIAARIEKGGPVPSDPDMGDFLDDTEKDPRDVAIANIDDHSTEAHKAVYAKIKNEDAQELYALIAKLGPDEYISKTTVSTYLGWGYARQKMALNYLVRNRYIKQINEKANKGTQYEAKQ